METRQPPYRILIVDDAPEVREALRWAFEDEPDLQIVGEAGSGHEALAGARLLAPDVVILDVELPDLDGYAVARGLKAAPPPPAVIFLSVHNDPLSQARGAEAGGDAFVEKGAGWAALLAQLRHTLARGQPPAA